MVSRQSCGHAFATSRNLMLKPFSVPGRMAETDTATTLFKQFKELYMIFSRRLQEGAKTSEMKINENRKP